VFRKTKRNGSNGNLPSVLRSSASVNILVRGSTCLARSNGNDPLSDVLPQSSRL
jgi:hypothetical protein